MALDFTTSNNASALKNIQKKSIQAGNKVVAIDIPLDQIDMNEDNDVVFNMDEIDFLAKGIEDEGFTGAINVFKKSDGRYELFSGHRRFLAVKKLKRTTIPCIVEEMPDSFKKVKKMLGANIRSRKLTPLEMARAMELYQREAKASGFKGNIGNLTAEFFNVSYIQVFRYLALIKLIPELQQLANNPSFPYSAFREAASLTVDGQKELYKQIMYALGENAQDEDEKEIKLTRSRIERLIAGIREKEEYQAKAPLKKKEKAVQEKSAENEKAIDTAKLKEFGIVYDAETTDEKEDDILIDEYNLPEETSKTHSHKKNISSKLIANVNSLSDLFLAETEDIPKDIARECIERLENIISKIKEKSN